MSKKYTTCEFINRAIILYGDKYDYSLVDYRKSKMDIIIICKKHGEFKQTPNSHLQNRGCPKCGGKNKLTTNEFIVNANIVHQNKYDYSLVYYVNNSTQIEIICNEHDKFKQTPDSHLRGRGCPKCVNKNVSTDEFIVKASFVHGKKYDYSLVNYINNITKIKIVCQTHGVFEQIPNSHLSGEGCPICKSSKGELLIKKYLDEHNVKYIKEKIFSDCKGDKRALPFDFYLPNQNILLEFDGIQHSKPISYFGGKRAYLSLKDRDEIKNRYAQKHNIFLLRIKHDEINNMEQILNNIL